jgi:hypothetical protein
VRNGKGVLINWPCKLDTAVHWHFLCAEILGNSSCEDTAWVGEAWTPLWMRLRNKDAWWFPKSSRCYQCCSSGFVWIAAIVDWCWPKRVVIEEGGGGRGMRLQIYVVEELWDPESTLDIGFVCCKVLRMKKKRSVVRQKSKYLCIFRKAQICCV